MRHVSASRPASRALALSAVVWLAACSGADRSPGDAARDSTTSPTTAVSSRALDTSEPPSANSTDDNTGDNTGDRTGDPAVDSILAAIRACPRDGLWHACSLERRLQLAGLRAVELDTATTIPGVPGAARSWEVGRRRLRAVFLTSAEEVHAVLAGLDSARAAPRGDETVVWPERVTLIHNANLIALYFGGSDRQVERVSNALMAGAPQPPSP